jgi:hypothetical protein
MIKQLLKGILFGVGFSVALIAAMEIYSKISPPDYQRDHSSTIGLSNEWNSYSHDEQIKKSTAIAVARYTESNDGSYVATISEIYKDNESVMLNIKIGDSYESLRFYPRKDNRLRSGVLIFFTGSPAIERATLYLYDDRIIGYGDMPLATAIEKSKKISITN